MKIPAALILLVASVASNQALDLSKLKSVKVNVPTNPKYTAVVWEKIRKNQVIAPVKYPGYKPGTIPQPGIKFDVMVYQPESAGKVFVHPRSRIVGGDIAYHGALPWQAFIVMDDIYICGGSLISDEWVLTAGSCVKGFYHFKVLLGAQNIQQSEEFGRVTVTTYEAILHENYEPHYARNDIALLKLPGKVEITAYINVARLPSYSMATEDLVGETVMVSGWGKYSDAIGSISADLRYVTMPVISNNNCANTFGNLITSSVMCTDTAGKRSSCNGDTGGPLVIQESDGCYAEVGIVSFGSSEGCEKEYPVAFTRVTSFLQWIETKTSIIIRP